MSPLPCPECDAVPLSEGSAEAEVADAYLAHRERLYASVLRATRDPELAEDVLQDAYLRLLVAVRSGQAPDNVPAWLHRVAMNLVIDRARRRRGADSGRGPIPSAAPDPETSVLERERAAELRSALAHLPRETRHALLLSGAGYGPREIAAFIGRTNAATRTLLCRARQRTRALLDAEAPSGA